MQPNEPRSSIVVLDGHALNPGDLDWKAIAEHGPLTVYDRSGSKVLERLANTAVALTNKEILSAPILEASPDLRYIGILATGTNVVDLEAATQRGIVVTNIPAYGTDSVAQHVFALLLELTNHVGSHARAVAEGSWSSCADFSFTVVPMTELAGKTLGIVGMGTIGQRVAQIGSAFGMTLLAARRDPKRAQRKPRTQPTDAAGVPLAVEFVSLDDLFARADVVTLHCPLTETTRGLVDADRLARMKSSAIVINTSRGGVVDESALAEALCAGRLGGAAVDVLGEEPPRSGSPLMGVPRCLVTPHIAWATVEARRRLIQIAADNIGDYVAGHARNVVNRDGLRG